MKNVFVVIYLLFPFEIIAQIVTTFAGGGTSGLGDGGIATAAQVYSPEGGVFDKFGNYYFAENLAHRVRKVSYSGIITTIAGNGTSGFSGDYSLATAAELNLPNALRLDKVGNIYITDAGNYRIRKVDAASGIITTFAGNGTSGFGGDNGPATSAMFNTPNDICFDTFGNMYIADYANHRIRKIDTSGIILTIAGTNTPGYSGDNGPATAAELRATQGLAIDNIGNLYIAGGNVVRKINPAGIITTVAGVDGTYIYLGDGVPATTSGMYPLKITIDPLGQLVIADYSNDRVFLVDDAGLISTIAGTGIAGFSGDNGQATAAKFNYPSGVTFDSCGNLYIPDIGNARIRKVEFNPTCNLSIPKVKTNTDITIYPNPASEEITISGVKTDVKWGLFNIKSIIEQQGILKKGNNTLSIESLSPGLYILELTMDDGTKIMKKIIKL